MANRKRKKKSLVSWPFVIFASAVLSVAVIITMADHFSFPSFVPTWDEVGDKLDDMAQDIVSNYDLPALKNDKELRVHYIDVGQGDSILIQYDGKNALVDSGEKSAADEVMGYLNNNSVSRIDLLIMTHPDSDHIGAMSEIIDNYEIGDIYMSPIPDELIPTTKTYTNMLLAISRKGLSISLAEAGDTIKFGNLELKCIAPEGEFASKNNTSLGFKLVHGENSFLFTGDMEKASEKSTLQSGYDVDADVLKLGHHGSNTSTTAAFLDAVSPEIAVISAAFENEYGHPHKEILERLNERGITIYRTDYDGDIVIVSDGLEMSVTTQK